MSPALWRSACSSSPCVFAGQPSITQCCLHARQPLYRTAFSVAALVITVQAAGLAFHSSGGRFGSMPTAELLPPLLVAAPVYFLVNSLLVASAIALSTRAAIAKTWHDSFLWS